MRLKVILILAGLGLAGTLFAAADKADKPAAKAPPKAVLTLDEFTIEGKLQKPQIVLISAEERPRFQPMAINKFSRQEDFLANIDKNIFEYEAYQKAFDIKSE